uniref:Protein CutA homolog n=1 Tax=Saccoglossus kowalevskii TaxID=10224 RepID=A0ABM0GNJ6_SACKO|nr:PREDICTED: protein CutA homolog [Saccoglossus kowalevskii]
MKHAAILGIICLSMSSVFWTGRRVLYAMASASYNSGLHSAAFVTCPDLDVAKKLARGLLEKELVACVNVIPGITSMYRWEGKIEEDNEVLLMIKTRTSKVPDVSTYVRENHPFDTAEVISMQIDQGNPPYLKWITDSVPSTEKNIFEKDFLL